VCVATAVANAAVMTTTITGFVALRVSTMRPKPEPKAKPDDYLVEVQQKKPMVSKIVVDVDE